MQKRKLGHQGLEVRCIGLGCMGMSWAYGGGGDDAESIAVIHRALDLGVDFFDTAEVYGPFTNEQLLGRALKGRRDGVVIATKFGFNIENNAMKGLNSRPENVKAVCDASLKRLGMDMIDLFYQHRVDKSVPIEDTVGAMADLVKAGKVRYLGLSEAGIDTITRAHKVHPISALQSEFSMWERNLEPEIIPLLRKLGIGLVPYAPLGRGFLTGTATRADQYRKDDFRFTDPRYQGENFDRNQAIVAEARRIAASHNATPGQVALAWVLAQGDDIVPIPGTKRRTYLEENVKAAEVKLSADELKTLSDIAAPGKVAGPRYTERGMASIDR
ncbi:MAG: aldo/keto reductase [Rhodospirillaceae bacterium]|nr:aldo/keto reductase [Rhodospirillaceae bacterium]